jgi:hypothetical protein
MNAHLTTVVSNSRSPFFGNWPTLQGAVGFGHGTEKLPEHEPEQPVVLLFGRRGESPSSASEFEDFPSIADAQEQEREDLDQVRSVSSSRDEALRRLAEIESFARSVDGAAIRGIALRSCRDAITLVSFWPSDLVVPDVDIDEDGIVTVEQFRPDGTLQAIFEFSEPERATFAVLAGARIVDRGFVPTRDASAMAGVFEVIRSATDDRE